MTETTDKKKLPAVVERFILHWGDMGDEWGVNRSVSQIHGLLYLAEAPMTAEDIAETLGMARSNVSNSIKELLSWNLIRRVPILGDRRDHYEAETDIWEVAARIAARRKERETRPRRRCAARLRLGRRRRSVHQPGREQAAEGNAGVHRTGRPLVRADAGRAAAEIGRADQAWREDRQFPPDGKNQIGTGSRGSVRWRQQAGSRDFQRPNLPATSCSTIIASTRCCRMRIGGVCRWRSGGGSPSGMPTARPSSMSARSTNHSLAGSAGGWRSSRA